MLLNAYKQLHLHCDDDYIDLRPFVFCNREAMSGIKYCRYEVVKDMK